MKSRETSKTWKFQCKYGEKWLPKFFYKLKFLQKKILIVTSLGVKVGMNLKMTPQTIFIAFLCDNFLQNLEFHVFLKQFPAKNIPKNIIIFCKTFRKSLTRLARLWKVSSCARLARLVKPILDLIIVRPFTPYKLMKSWRPRCPLIYSKWLLLLRFFLILKQNHDIFQFF